METANIHAQFKIIRVGFHDLADLIFKLGSRRVNRLQPLLFVYLLSSEFLVKYMYYDSEPFSSL